MKFLCIHIPRKGKVSPNTADPPRPGQLSRRPSFRDRYNSNQQLRRRRSSRILDYRDAYAPSPVSPPVRKRKMSVESLNSNHASKSKTGASGIMPPRSTDVAGSSTSTNVPKPISRSPSLHSTRSRTNRRPIDNPTAVPTTSRSAVQASRPRIRISAIVDLAQAQDATTMSWALWEIEREMRSGDISESDRLPGLHQVLEKARVVKEKRYLESRQEIQAQLRACGYEIR